MEDINVQGLEEVINKGAEEGFRESVVDKPIPVNIEEEEVYSKVLGEYEQEAAKLQEMETRLCRHQEVLDKQKDRYVPDLKPMCDLDLNTILFEIRNPYRSAKSPYRCSTRL